MSPYEKFNQEGREEIVRMGADPRLAAATREWVALANPHKYSYHFEWLGRPIIQYPQDMVAMQELVWQVQPDLIIETGIAHGGSLVLSASLLAMLDYCDAVRSGTVLDPLKPSRRVVGIDIDIRTHNREAIEAHPMASRIDLVQGSSIATDVVDKVRELARGFRRVMVFLDSNHTHEHVLAELQAYGPLTSPGSYCCVFDTIIEDLPADAFPDRPWGPGDNPKTAVHAWLAQLQQAPAAGQDGTALRFEIDRAMQDKLQITVAPDGFLRRVDGTTG